MTVVPSATRAGDGESHGNAVIGMRIDFRAAQFLTAGHAEAVRKFLHLCPHAAQVFRHCRQAVAFLNAQFCGAPER